MLQNFAQSALDALDCQLVWVLINKDDYLITDTIVGIDDNVKQQFMNALETHYPRGHFSVTYNNNPLAEILLRNTPLVSIETEKLETIAGGKVLSAFLLSIDLTVVTIAPIRQGEHLFGVMVFGNSEPFTTTPSDYNKQLVKVLRRQAILELENDYLANQIDHLQAEIEESSSGEIHEHELVLEQQTRRLAALNRASQAISSPLDLQDVIQVILSSAQEVIQAVVAAILLRDSNDNLVVVATLGMDGQPMPDEFTGVATGIARWSAQHAQSLLVPQVSEDPRFSLDSGNSKLEVDSMVAVPLIASNEAIGVLTGINRKTGIFNKADLEILESLGASAAVAIENASLFDQTHRRLTELSTLLDASAVVSSTPDLSQMLEHIARRLREALNVERVVINTIDKDTNLTTKLVEVVDAKWGDYEAPSFKVHDIPSKQKALQYQQPTTVNLSPIHENTIEQVELRARGMTSSLNVPLLFNDSVIGLITFYDETTIDSRLSTMMAKTVETWQDSTSEPWNELTVLCHKALQATGLRWCSVYSWDEQNESLKLLREIGIHSWKNNRLHEQSEDFTNITQVIDTSGIALTTTNDLPKSIEKSYFNTIGTSSSLGAPITIHSQVIGVVQLMKVRNDDFDDSAFSLAFGVANIIGNALENNNLYTSLQKRAEALEAAYREIQDSNRLKDELLQNISHELGTPLTHILGTLSLLEDGTFGTVTTEQQEQIQFVLRKTTHIAELLRRMVTVHGSNAYNLDLKETSLQQLAELAIRSIFPKAKAAGIKIVAKIQPNLPTVRVDQSTMSDVFEALIDNAIKFSGDSKQIEVLIRNTTDSTIQVSVCDSGIGIPKEEQGKIFRQFYQVDGSTTRRYPGMGLGLALVERIITAHRGRVWVESEIDKGTRIHFTLPKSQLSNSNLTDAGPFQKVLA